MPFRKSAEVCSVPPVLKASCPPSDADLLASMAGRLSQAETQLAAARAEVGEKETRMRELERRLSSLPPSLPLSRDDHEQLRRKCEALQKQVQEMEVNPCHLHLISLSFRQIN